MAWRIIEIAELKNVQSGFKVVFGEGEDMKELTYLTIVDDHALFMEGFASPIDGYCSVDYAEFITSSRKLIESIVNIPDVQKVVAIKRISDETIVEIDVENTTQKYEIPLTINPFLHDSYVALVLDGAEWKMTDLMEFPFAVYQHDDHKTVEELRHTEHFTDMCIEVRPSVSVLLANVDGLEKTSIVFDLQSVISSDPKFAELWNGRTSGEFMEIVQTLRLADESVVVQIDESLSYFKIIGVEPESTPTIIDLVWNSIKSTIGY